nr:DUF4268 domain-containing protein [Chlorobium phaeovibrioides]
MFSNISPSKDHWISAGSGVRSCPFSLIFGAKVIRVEFNMQRPITEENKFIFGELLKSKEKIQKAFGSDLELEWLKLDSKKASRIQHKMSVDGYNKDNWPSMIEWMNDKMVGLEKAIKPFLPNINNKLRDEIYQDAGE